MGASALAVLLALRLHGQGVPQPEIVGSLTTTNSFKIAITNAVATNVYEIHWTPVVGNRDLYDWFFLGRGAVGQSNFYVTNLVGNAGFFQATSSFNWDGDGANNDVDGQPLNSSVGALTIVIDYPTQNLVLQ